eukprot:GSChrysophyteH1.ASY1.ANO1.941.1 assembled CDS
MSSIPSGGMQKRVAVVGAGAAGLVALEALKRISSLKVTAYEKSVGLGGVWNMRQNTKEGSANPMYKTLLTNLPCQIMAINEDTPFSCTNERSFIGHEEVQDYLQSFADEHKLHENIRYGTEVVSVRKNLGGGWELETTSVSSPSTRESSSSFDYVIICNGHYSTCNYPTGQEMQQTAMSSFGTKRKTPVTVMHSADYNGPEAAIFAGKNVLLVGGRNSATDLAREIATVALAVHCSDRNHVRDSVANDCKREEGEHYSGIKHYNADTHTIEFCSGEKLSDVDVLVWCTGYKYDFPFLESPWNTVNATGRRVERLFEQLFHVEDPSLMFIGLPFSVVPFPLFYVQALLCASSAAGLLQLPSREQRTQCLASWESDLAAKNCLTDSKYHFLGLGDEQWQYSARLLTYIESGAESIFGINVKEIQRHLSVCKEIYRENRARKPAKVGYHDSYRSVRYAILPPRAGGQSRWDLEDPVAARR